jgi:hypothetical protein
VIEKVYQISLFENIKLKGDAPRYSDEEYSHYKIGAL